MKKLEQLRTYLRTIQNQNYELIWAKTWDDTKKDIEWILNLPGISPGRWAVGYNYLYVLTRVLHELRPHSALDFGLGISGTLFSTYFDFFNYPDGDHTIIEHDKEWIEFYSKNNRISSATHIEAVSCIEKVYRGNKYTAYNNLESLLKNKKYTVISIDGPKGSDRYSRRDILEFLPEILNNSFVILVDDAERVGEKDTIYEIRKKLSNNGIEFCEGLYPGMTECVIFTSINNRFLCTM